jgi:hypothetical protein
VSGSTQGRTVQARTALIARRGGPIHSRTINLCVLTSAIALDGNRGIHRPLFNRCQWLEGVRAPQRFDELPRHDRWGVAGHPRSRHPTPHPSRTRHRNPAESDWLPGWDWGAANAVPARAGRRKKIRKSASTNLRNSSDSAGVATPRTARCCPRRVVERDSPHAAPALQMTAKGSVILGSC